ncbi:adhesion G-protein coupled receptor G2-like isoform X5 [Myxocyprinus asiaticus]|uniref:adhesion G-protein coupled receptor G2-like isoform X5 n=1 Tax=Myxocyprinus asiaticus TaxID=70543 RepID=UPI00222187BA|nr:adhesion G-protein coupled receptor G2-like isoform X5 [Myxocyprinus asiaticus]
MDRPLGIMFRLKQIFLWVIIYCTTYQMSCAKIIIVGDHLKNTNFQNCTGTVIPAMKICHQISDTLMGDLCIINVKQNTTSQGYCEITAVKKYSFTITKHDGNYEVIMTETVTDIQMWFWPDDVKCLPSQVLTSADNSCTSCLCGQKGCLEIPTVDPGKRCENATYNASVCSGKNGNMYVLIVNGNKTTCVNCINQSKMTSTTPVKPSQTTSTADKTYETSTTPVKPSQTTSTATESTTNAEYKGFPIDETLNIAINKDDPNPSKASDALDNLENLTYLMEKENKSSVAAVIGDVKGLVFRQDKNKETQDINIYYSSNQDSMIVGNKSIQEVNFPWSVKISKEAFDKSRLENNGSAFVGVLRFKNMGNNDGNQMILNNEVYGITMGANISNLTNNIELFFKPSKKLDGNVSCNSWNGRGKLEWTRFGCNTTMINKDTIKCSCSHLTFFAILMSLPDSNLTAPHVESLTFITNIGCGLSMFFLGMGLFMHFLLRKAKSNQATKILINMFVALFLLNLSFLCNESIANTQDNSACIVIALIMHYSMLSTFTWFFIQALHMYLWLIRQNVTTKNYMRKINVAGWACPAPIVVIIVSMGEYKTVIIQSTAKTTRMCWITNPYVHYIVNIGYYALVFIFTTGIFIMMVTKIIQSRNINVGDVKKTTFKKQLTMILSLFFLFGLTWGIAFFSFGPMVIPSYYIFTVLNSFQGFFLFLYYYHIHNDVEGRFSDDPDSSSSSSTKTLESSIDHAPSNA